jgi:RNA 3'-terminal phosphate cyclase (ATP)
MLAVKKTIQIDGAQGEGGGQMLRSALSLSLLTGQPFQMEQIRAGRQKPGLLRQHLAAVQAATQIGAAEVEGARLGSQSLSFAPKTIEAGDYKFVVGSAGSGTLVFQTILPALMLAAGASTVTIEGGTHNESAPPFDFLDKTFLPFIRRMGPQVDLTLERYGFYPAGGGRFQARITPCTELQGLHTGVRGNIVSKRATAVVAHLPGHIAKRELEMAAELFSGSLETHVVDTELSPGPGNVVMIQIVSDAVCETFTAFGRLGVSAETVAKEAVREAREYLASSAVAGEHLADQLLLPLALAGGGSFTATKLTQHVTTNMKIVELFLPVRFETVVHDKYVEVFVRGG